MDEEKKTNMFEGIMASKLVNDLIQYIGEYGDIPVCLNTGTDMSTARLLSSSLVLELKPVVENTEEEFNTETFVMLSSCSLEELGIVMNEPEAE